MWDHVCKDQAKHLANKCYFYSGECSITLLEEGEWEHHRGWYPHLPFLAALPHFSPSSNCLRIYTSVCPRLQPVMAPTLSGFLVPQLQADSVSLNTKTSFLRGRQYLEQLEIRCTYLNQPAGYSWKWVQEEAEEKGQGHLSPPRTVDTPALPLIAWVWAHDLISLSL